MQTRKIRCLNVFLLYMFRTHETSHGFIQLVSVLVDAGLIVVGLELVGWVAAMAVVVDRYVDERVVSPVYGSSCREPSTSGGHSGRSAALN